MAAHTHCDNAGRNRRMSQEVGTIASFRIGAADRISLLERLLFTGHAVKQIVCLPPVSDTKAVPLTGRNGAASGQGLGTFGWLAVAWARL
jgi:hypothetical protein